MIDYLHSSHRRLNILTGEWILVSPHRENRPWQGKIEKTSKSKLSDYEASCYLCPNNKRANGEINPNYSSTFVFENDFSAFSNDKNIVNDNLIKNKIIKSKSEKGISKVVCFSPKHDSTLAQMSVDEIKSVIDIWCSEYNSLGNKNEINYVQIFENKGDVMGCSNPHPHGQIWATESIPNEPKKETIQLKKYFKKNKLCLLCNYINLEKKLNERIIFEGKDFIWLVPFWATWPFETMIVPKKHLRSLNDFSDSNKKSFAEILKKATSDYDKLFNVSFPYSGGIHQSPTDGKKHKEWHFHFHFYPPLLRSSSIKKFMVGYEMLAEPQRDFLPENAVKRLREIVK